MRYFLLDPEGVKLSITPGEEELPAPILIGDETWGIKSDPVLGARPKSGFGKEYGLPAQRKQNQRIVYGKAQVRRLALGEDIGHGE